MSDGQIEKILWAYRDRIQDLERDRRLRYVLVFKNYGWEAGALLAHPHSQLIALPIIPKAVMEELRGVKKYFRIKERCVFCDIIRQEMEQDIRVVVQNKHFFSYTPFASRFPFETCLLPKRHECCFTRISKEEMIDLARILKTILAALSRTLGDPAYNFLLHIAPNALPNGEEAKSVEQNFHWHLEIMPRLIRGVGLASGSGLYLNPTPPEEAAARLRESLA
jgi:UDPglucose--hexose-1-phosphate uridylyltransferase